MKSNTILNILLLCSVAILVLVIFVVNEPSFFVKTVNDISQSDSSNEVTIAQNIRDEKEKNTVQTAASSLAAASKPLEGESFQIEYSQIKKSYDVDIDAQTLEEYRTIKEQAENQIRGSINSDICSINVSFIVPIEIKGQMVWEDLFVTGCAPEYL